MLVETRRHPYKPHCYSCRTMKRKSIFGMGVLAWIPAAILLFSGARVDLASSATTEESLPKGSLFGNNLDSSSKIPLHLANAQIDWLVSKGGFFDDNKIAIRPVTNNDNDNHYEKEGDPSESCSIGTNLGIFATNDIEEGDTLMEIPLALFPRFDEEIGDYCDTAVLLVDELRKGDTSEFAPYLNYLKSMEGNLAIPFMWSSKGKELLEKIHETQKFPNSLTDTSFVKDCLDEKDAAELSERSKQQVEFAYALTRSRSWDAKLIPLADIINHSGENNVAMILLRDGKPNDRNPDTIEIHALDDIAKGDELTLDYRNHDSTHHLGSMLHDYGFVAKYPQTWRIPTPGKRSKIEENTVPYQIQFTVFQEDEENPDEFEIEWEEPENPPGFQVIEDHIRSNLNRLEEMESMILTEAAELASSTEQLVILEYFRFAVTAHKILIPSIRDAISLRPPVEEYVGDRFMACDDFEDIFSEIDGWRFYDGSDSSHQTVDIYYNDEKKDACLFLNEYLHACLSNRPHYHEVFVHYPAYFLEKVKRILFIGGGDSMVLHEALKYEEELELVVGLELDQHVVRSTFSMMGMEPHFHNDKVEWWFGDAAATLNLIPTEYYGTFDLVVVDVLSEVAESLKVTDDVTIMEAAMMLMQPNGIIIKNEDEGYIPGSYNQTKFMEYSTDVVSLDVPVYCLQTFVMGSNTINFSQTKPVDHKVSNFYIQGVDTFQSQFKTWHTLGTNAEAKKEDRDDPPVGPRTFGLALIIDAEDLRIPLDSSEKIQLHIEKVISSVELALIKTITHDLDGGCTLVSVLEEGSITARCFTDDKYCAIDVHLWKSAHIAESIKRELLSTLESNDSSAFRVITTGVFGVEEDDNNPKIGPPPKSDADTSNDETEDTEIETIFHEMNDPSINFKNATTDDYDFSNAFEQWKAQDPMAVQTISRFQLEEEWTRAEMKPSLIQMLNEAMLASWNQLEKEENREKHIEAFEIGNGLAVVATFFEGSALCVWDGESRVDATIFSLNEEASVYQGIIRYILEREGMEPIDVEVFPRGIGRVINLRKSLGEDDETGERPRPFWAPPATTTD